MEKRNFIKNKKIKTCLSDMSKLLIVLLLLEGGVHIIGYEHRILWGYSYAMLLQYALLFTTLMILFLFLLDCILPNSTNKKEEERQEEKQEKQERNSIVINQVNIEKQYLSGRASQNINLHNSHENNK